MDFAVILRASRSGRVDRVPAHLLRASRLRRMTAVPCSHSREPAPAYGAATHTQILPGREMAVML